MIHTNHGKVTLASADHVYANMQDMVSDSDLQQWSIGTKLISLRPGGLGGGREVFLNKSYLLFYTKTLATPERGYPEQTYAHTLGGTRKGDPHWGVWVLDPLNAWRDIHLQELRTGGFPSAIGGFNDSGGDFSYSQGGKPYTPPAYDHPIPIDQWRADIAALLGYWQKNDGRTLHCVNGLNPFSVNLYPPMVGMIENAFGSAGVSLPGGNTWLAHARLVCDAQSAGWTPWVFCKMRSQDQDVWKRWRDYMCATILLLDKGSLLFELGGMEGTRPPYISKEYQNPAYSPGIGKPTQTLPDFLQYKQRDGSFIRHFERGYVRIDPVHITATIHKGVA